MLECTRKRMATQVRSCPKCSQLMWLREDQYEVLDEETLRSKCPHCGSAVRFKLVTVGENATGPKMGH
jgi:DNA-directed RNA polymerase subunit M/transcription elongation factor TFIIS